MDKNSIKEKSKQLRLSSLVLISLILLCLMPLTIFYLFIQKEVVSDLRVLEEEQQLLQMEDKLGVLKSKIDAYKDMIGFVSQLPAVIEILDKGVEMAGSISRKTAYERYAGVLSRAFQRNNDVISIHILDLDSKVRFSLLKDPETTQYQQIVATSPNFDPEFLGKTIKMDQKGFLMSPLIPSDKERGENDSSLQLLLRIFTPIILKKETIGIFCSDIDIGMLANFMPEIHWVLNNGSYLFHEKSDKNAFVNFPGLQDIFHANKAVVWRDGQKVMAWMPFLRGKDVSLDLWAGKEIALTAVQSTRQNLLLDMLKIFLILLTLILFMSFWFSKYTQRISIRFLNGLRQAIFHQKKAFPAADIKIRELSDFSENLSYILGENNRLESQRRQTLAELQKALDEVKTLQGILPICSSCKKIRDDKGSWSQVEKYIRDHSEAEFSHSICPECAEKYYEDLNKLLGQKK